ncbi:MAG: SUMF1/EgtB/PvdO family nonheme iron enzyme [Pseudomonadota bacterium]|nr:SUMF1/EgtB/PvdO family nonheme iron enzyme [Pseudomonadota bacterium]
MYFEIGAAQIQGGRDYQEDYFQVTFPDEAAVEKTEALLVMADGMGGHAGGAVASQIVVDRILQYIDKQGVTGQITTTLRQALDFANQGLLERVRKQPELTGMGCTLVGVVLREDSLQWVSVGDSLLYVLRGAEVIRKNDDHSYGGYIDKLAAAGEPIPETPGFSPRRNMLMSYINGEEIAMVDLPFSAEHLYAGDRIIIASDGLDTISSDAFPEISAAAASAQEFAEALIAAVEVAGKKNQDNTTVIVADVLGEPLDSTGQEELSEWMGDTLQPLADDETLNPVLREDREAIRNLDATLPPTAAGVPPESTGPSADTPAEPPSVIDPPGPRPGEQPAATEQVAAPPGAEEAADPGPTAGDPRTTTTADTTQSAASAATVAPPGAGKAAGTQRAALFIGVCLAVLVGGGYFFLRGGDGAMPVEAPRATPAPVAPLPPVERPGEGTEDSVPVEDAEVRQAAVDTVPAAPSPVATTREIRDRLRSGGQGPVMLELPGGMFEMGSPAHSLNFDERPQHSVEVKPFAIGRFEVTFADYRRFTAAAKTSDPADAGWGHADRPVINVSWNDAQAYAAWLSRQTGETYRLPSEAEWEYAARAGTPDDYWWGITMKTDAANCWGCGSALGEQTVPVGSFAANPWGLADTAGNVAEWVADCYHPTYSGAPADGSAWVDPGCTERVVRGGSWNGTAEAARVTKRMALAADAQRDFVGFRLVREID